MIIGARSIIYSKDPDADRVFVRDVLGFGSVDVGGVMCEDVEKFMADMRARDVPCSEIHEEPWGLLTQVTLPGGGRLGVYQPLHERPA